MFGVKSPLIDEPCQPIEILEPANLQADGGKMLSGKHASQNTVHVQLHRFR